MSVLEFAANVGASGVGIHHRPRTMLCTSLGRIMDIGNSFGKPRNASFDAFEY